MKLFSRAIILSSLSLLTACSFQAHRAAPVVTLTAEMSNQAYAADPSTNSAQSAAPRGDSTTVYNYANSHANSYANAQVSNVQYPTNHADVYQVQPGDTLYSIAFGAGQDVATLASLNGLTDPSLIQVGQWLRLKPFTQSMPAVQPATPPVYTYSQPQSQPQQTAPSQIEGYLPTTHYSPQSYLAPVPAPAPEPVIPVPPAPITPMPVAPAPTVSAAPTTPISPSVATTSAALALAQEIQRAQNTAKSTITNQSTVEPPIVTKAPAKDGVVTASKPAAEKALANTQPSAYSSTSAKQVVDNKVAKETPKEVIQPVEKSTKGLPKTVSKWQWPVQGKLIGTFSDSEQGNKGIKISNDRGSKISAVAEGQVVYAGNALRGYGNLVIIKHTEEYLSAYAHTQEILVKEKQHVTAGQTVATMGSSGSNQVMLHFEIRHLGKSVDPLKFLPKQ